MQILEGRCCYMNDTLLTHPHRVMRVNQTTIEQHKLSLYYKTVPAHFAPRGLFWWRAQLTNYIFKPLPHRRPGPSPRLGISMHVRHDNIAEADPIPTQSYVDQAKVAAEVLHRASDWPPNSSVSLYLATDTPETEAEVLKAIKAHNKRSSCLMTCRRALHLCPKSMAQPLNSRTHSHQETVEIFQAIGRLWDSDIFIGKFSSGVSRLIAELGCVK
mmetsp:Transcript_31867/g.49819  ORF Transcript_31867/g.49819 Transcript_31867/m.49819 type:complete len:215 (+) Transcript_31867:99-743(+)